MKDIFQEIFTSFKVNKLRTFLTGFAISWGIFMLVVLLACGNGLNNSMKRNFDFMSRNAVSVDCGWTSKPFAGKERWRKLEFSQLDVDFLRHNLKYVEYFSPDVYVDGGTLSYNNLENDVSLQGVEPQFKDIRVFSMVAGRFINDIDLKSNRKVAVIDKELAEKLFISADNALGKDVKLKNDIYFNIVGVYKTKGRNFRSEVFIPFSTANIVYNPSGKISNVIFSLVDDAPDRDYAQDVRDMLSPRMSFAPDDTNALWIMDFKKSYNDSKLIFRGLSLFIWIIGLSTLMAGIVGVGNIMLITVKERTREFGIRKAIGATPGSIIRMVVTEAVIVTSLFGYLGMLLGMGVSQILCLIFPANATPADGSFSIFENPSVDVSTVISATVVLIVSGVLAGYFPARKAVSVKPIEAMMAK